MPLADQLLDAGTGKAGEGVGKVTVQPLSRPAWRDGEAVRYRRQGLDPAPAYQALEGIRPMGRIRTSTRASLKWFVLRAISGSTLLW